MLPFLPAEALKIALATAGATKATEGSPMPPGASWSSCSTLTATRTIRVLSVQPVAERAEAVALYRRFAAEAAGSVDGEHDHG